MPRVWPLIQLACSLCKVLAIEESLVFGSSDCWALLGFAQAFQSLLPGPPLEFVSVLPSLKGVCVPKHSPWAPYLSPDLSLIFGGFKT